MYEIRNELVHIIVNEYIYVDPALAQLRMTPYDIQVTFILLIYKAVYIIFVYNIEICMKEKPQIYLKIKHFKCIKTF